MTWIILFCLLLFVGLSLVLLLLVYLSHNIPAELHQNTDTHLSWPIQPNVVYEGPLLPAVVFSATT